MLDITAHEKYVVDGPTVRHTWEVWEGMDGGTCTHGRITVRMAVGL